MESSSLFTHALDGLLAALHLEYASTGGKVNLAGIIVGGAIVLTVIISADVLVLAANFFLRLMKRRLIPYLSDASKIGMICAFFIYAFASVSVVEWKPSAPPAVNVDSPMLGKAIVQKHLGTEEKDRLSRKQSAAP